MRIGVMADTHDRVPAIHSLLERLSAKGVSIVMHAGDYCSPFSLAPYHERGMALLGVFGRNDGDRETLAALSELERLRVVQTLSAGTDWIEARVPAWATLCNARGTRDTAVAEWVVGALLGDAYGLATSARTRR